MYKSHALPGRIQHSGFIYAHLSYILNVSHESFDSNKSYRRNKGLQANGFLVVAFRKKRKKTSWKTPYKQKTITSIYFKIFSTKMAERQIQVFFMENVNQLMINVLSRISLSDDDSLVLSQRRRLLIIWYLISTILIIIVRKSIKDQRSWIQN